MKEEYLDILDEEGNKTGESKLYDEVHERGLVHAAVHVWIINSHNKILIQKREKNRRFYPSYWDISASGHISAGETSLEAAKKEVKEELGLDFDGTDFTFLCRIKESFTIDKYLNKEFDDVYIIRGEISINDMKLSDEEVEEVRFLSISQFKQWVADGMEEKMVPHEEYKILLDYLETKNSSSNIVH